MIVCDTKEGVKSAIKKKIVKNVAEQIVQGMGEFPKAVYEQLVCVVEADMLKRMCVNEKDVGC